MFSRYLLLCDIVLNTNESANCLTYSKIRSGKRFKATSSIKRFSFRVIIPICQIKFQLICHQE